MAKATQRRLYRIKFAGGARVAALALAALSLSSAVSAQAPGSPGQPPPRPERPDARPPAALQAENYEPLGVRVGGFLLFPSLEIDEAYNDNVFAVSSASGPVASFLQVIIPSLELRSTWSTNMLNFYARGNIGFYTAAPAVNYQDVSVGVEGRIDIQRNWNTYGSLSFNRLHESPGLPNTVSGSPNVTIYNQTTGSLGYYQKVNRFSARVDVRADKFSYLNNGLGPTQGVVPNFDRDRTELREALRLGYEFIDGYEIWVRGGLNQRQYVNPIDVSGFARNSSGWDLVSGVSLDLGGITTAEAFIGYFKQNYVGFPALEGPQFGLTAYWNPLKELLVKPYVRRTINEAAYIGDSGYLNTSMGFDVTYKILPNVKLDGRADYTIADYQSFSTTNNQYDQYVAFSAGAMYMPVSEFFIGPAYQYIYRNSNLPNNNYGQNIIMLRLGARL